MSEQVSKLPTARHFYEAVVHVVGLMCEFDPDRLIDMEEVLPKVLAYADIDPDNLPRGWELKGYSGLYRRIGWAHRNQREGYCRNPLTILGKKRGTWGLTSDGIKLAKKIARERKKS